MENTKYNITIASLIAKSTGGDISEEEVAYLKDWLDTSEANRLLYHRLRANLSIEINIEQDKEAKLRLWNTIDKKIKKNERKSIFLKLQVAASILIIVAVGAFFTLSNTFTSINTTEALAQIDSKKPILINSSGDSFLLSTDTKFSESSVNINANKEGELVYKSNKSNTKASIQYNTILIPKGGHLKLQLADGSNVWLNSNSKLKYPVNFIGDKRQVFLEGEAFFEVEKNKNKPFIVSVNDMSVRVYGTSFNVSAYDNSNEIITTLVEGSVKLQSKSGVDKFIKPDDQFIFNKESGGYVLEQVDTRIYTAWVNGRFAFHREKLSSIMDRLSRIYDVDVHYRNSRLRDIKFSGEIALYDDINEILDMLEVTQKVKFNINENLVIIDKY